jgi:hypothetical protein
MDKYRRFKRAEMLIPGLAIKHELAQRDRDMLEQRTGEVSDPYLRRKQMLESAYQEIAGTKGLARMARADHKYKTGTHRLRLLERKL